MSLLNFGALRIHQFGHFVALIVRYRLINVGDISNGHTPNFWFCSGEIIAFHTISD